MVEDGERGDKDDKNRQEGRQGTGKEMMRRERVGKEYEGEYAEELRQKLFSFTKGYFLAHASESK